MKIKKLILLLLSLVTLIFATPAYAIDTHGYGQGSCSSGSICYDGNYNSTNLKPGYRCGSLADWHFGTDGGNPAGVPSCGAFGRFCCDPGPATLNPATDPHYTLPSCSKKSTDGGCAAVDTAIGTINTSVPALVSTIFTILLGLGGGVAILLIIASGYQMMMSQGNPEKVKETRERLTSAIVGLLFMIFSATILQIIGVNILNLPGFH